MIKNIPNYDIRNNHIDVIEKNNVIQYTIYVSQTWDYLKNILNNNDFFNNFPNNEFKPYGRNAIKSINSLQYNTFHILTRDEPFENNLNITLNNFIPLGSKISWFEKYNSSGFEIPKLDDSTKSWRVMGFNQTIGYSTSFLISLVEKNLATNTTRILYTGVPKIQSYNQTEINISIENIYNSNLETQSDTKLRNNFNGKFYGTVGNILNDIQSKGDIKLTGSIGDITGLEYSDANVNLINKKIYYNDRLDNSIFYSIVTEINKNSFKMFNLFAYEFSDLVNIVDNYQWNNTFRNNILDTDIVLESFEYINEKYLLISQKYSDNNLSSLTDDDYRRLDYTGRGKLELYKLLFDNNTKKYSIDNDSKQTIDNDIYIGYSKYSRIPRNRLYENSDAFRNLIEENNLVGSGMDFQLLDNEYFTNNIIDENYDLDFRPYFLNANIFYLNAYQFNQAESYKLNYHEKNIKNKDNIQPNIYNEVMELQNFNIYKDYYDIQKPLFFSKDGWIYYQKCNMTDIEDSGYFGIYRYDFVNEVEEKISEFNYECFDFMEHEGYLYILSFNPFTKNSFGYYGKCYLHRYNFDTNIFELYNDIDSNLNQCYNLHLVQKISDFAIGLFNNKKCYELVGNDFQLIADYDIYETFLNTNKYNKKLNAFAINQSDKLIYKIDQFGTNQFTQFETDNISNYTQSSFFWNNGTEDIFFGFNEMTLVSFLTNIQIKLFETESDNLLQSILGISDFSSRCVNISDTGYINLINNNEIDNSDCINISNENIVDYQIRNIKESVRQFKTNIYTPNNDISKRIEISQNTQNEYEEIIDFKFTEGTSTDSNFNFYMEITDITESNIACNVEIKSNGSYLNYIYEDLVFDIDFYDVCKIIFPLEYMDFDFDINIFQFIINFSRAYELLSVGDSFDFYISNNNLEQREIYNYLFFGYGMNDKYLKNKNVDRNSVVNYTKQFYKYLSKTKKSFIFELNGLLFDLKPPVLVYIDYPELYLNNEFYVFNVEYLFESYKTIIYCIEKNIELN